MKAMRVLWQNMHTTKKRRCNKPLFNAMQRPWLLSKNTVSSEQLEIGCEGTYKNHIPCSKLMHVFKSLVNLQEEVFQQFFWLKVWGGEKGAAVPRLSNEMWHSGVSSGELEVKLFHCTILSTCVSWPKTDNEILPDIQPQSWSFHPDETTNKWIINGDSLSNIIEP